MAPTPRAQHLGELLRLDGRRALGHLLHALGIDWHPQPAEYLAKRRLERHRVQALPTAQRLGAHAQRHGSLALRELVVRAPACEHGGELGWSDRIAAHRLAPFADLPDDGAEGEVEWDGAPGDPVAQGAVAAAEGGGGFGIAVTVAGAPLAQHRGELNRVHAPHSSFP